MPLLIEDFERILEPVSGARHRVRDLAERDALAAVLQAFSPARSDSRLILSSRFAFSLPVGGQELAAELHELHLSRLEERAQRKLRFRQISTAQSSYREGSALDDVALAARLPLLGRA